MGQAMTERKIKSVLREVTEEEVACYQEYGWVMMRQLVAPEFAAELLRAGQEWSERSGKETAPGPASPGRRAPSRSVRSCSASACHRTRCDS